MQNSNRSFQIAVLSLGAVLLISVACMRPKTYKQDDVGFGDASFSLDKDKKITASAKITEMEEISAPAMKVYSLKGCLKEHKTERPVTNEFFSLTGDDGLKQDVTTDGKGCFTWEEKLPFNFVADECYLPRNRKLTAREDSLQRGSIDVKIGLNPWLRTKGAPEVLDLASGDSAPEGLKLVEEKDLKSRMEGSKPLSDSGSSVDERTQPTLALTHVSLTTGTLAQVPSSVQPSAQPSVPSTVPSSDPGRDLLRKIHLMFKPAIVFATADEDKSRAQILKKANLQAQAVLIATLETATGIVKRVVWSSESVQSDQPGGFKFTFNIDAASPASLDASSGASYSLLVRVSLAKAPLGLRPFEGVFVLGSKIRLFEIEPRVEISDTNIQTPAFSYDSLLREINGSQEISASPQTKK